MCEGLQCRATRCDCCPSFCGYRATRDNHHHRVLQSLEFTIAAGRKFTDTLDGFRKKRNAATMSLVETVMIRPSLKQLARARLRTCASCGGALQPFSRTKYDPFWMIVLIVAGAASAFYLIGIAIMALGMVLLRQEVTLWACPMCTNPKTRPSTSSF